MVFLSHAPHHADDFLWVLFFDFPQPAQRTVGFVFGLFAHGASVQQDRISAIDIFGKLIALTAKVGNDHLAVEHIHLAADGFDVQFVHGGADLVELRQSPVV